MGKVFTVEDIQAGNVPEAGAHILAARHVMEILFDDGARFRPDEGINDTGIYAGMVHGSSVYGSANVRSDLDVLAICQLGSDSIDTMSIVHNAFEDVQRRFKVPVEANVLTHEDIITHSHKIDALFLRSLLQAEQNPAFSWNSPASSISTGFGENDYTPNALLLTTCRYVGAKSASFAKALALDGEDTYVRLQRALELPKNLGRKVLGMQESCFNAAITPSVDILSGLQNFVKVTADQDYLGPTAKKIKSRLVELSERDKEYSCLLSNVIGGTITLKQYDVWLQEHTRPTLNAALTVSHSMLALLMHYRNQTHPTKHYNSDQEQLAFFSVDDYFDIQDTLVY